MLSIRTMIDLVKQNKNLKSDREAAEFLGVSNLSPYIAGKAVFKDETALKIAQYSGLRDEIVLSSCKAAVAEKKNNHKAIKAWANIYQTILTAKNFTLLLLLILSPTLFPSSSDAGTRQDVAEQGHEIYIMLHSVLFFVAIAYFLTLI